MNQANWLYLHTYLLIKPYCPKYIKVPFLEWGKWVIWVIFWASVKSPCSCFMLSLICLVYWRLTHLHDSFLTPSQNVVPASKTTNTVVLGFDTCPHRSHPVNLITWILLTPELTLSMAMGMTYHHDPGLLYRLLGPQCMNHWPARTIHTLIRYHSRFLTDPLTVMDQMLSPPRISYILSQRWTYLFKQKQPHRDPRPPIPIKGRVGGANILIIYVTLSYTSYLHTIYIHSLTTIFQLINRSIVIFNRFSSCHYSLHLIRALHIPISK